MSSNAPRTSVRPWIIPLLTGIIGLLLGSLVTLGIVALATLDHASAVTAKLPTAAITAANAKYRQALFDCAVQPSGSLVITSKTGTLRVVSQSADGSVAGLSLDSATCLANSLGASPSTVTHMSNADSDGFPARHASNLPGLHLNWISRGDGGITIVVSPRLAQ